MSKWRPFCVYCAVLNHATGFVFLPKSVFPSVVSVCSLRNGIGIYAGRYTVLPNTYVFVRPASGNYAGFVGPVIVFMLVLSDQQLLIYAGSVRPVTVIYAGFIRPVIDGGFCQTSNWELCCFCWASNCIYAGFVGPATWFLLFLSAQRLWFMLVPSDQRLWFMTKTRTRVKFINLINTHSNSIYLCQ